MVYLSYTISFIAFKAISLLSEPNPNEKQFNFTCMENNGLYLKYFLGTRESKATNFSELEFEKAKLFREIYKAEVQPISGSFRFWIV